MYKSLIFKAYPQWALLISQWRHNTQYITLNNLQKLLPSRLNKASSITFSVLWCPSGVLPAEAVLGPGVQHSGLSMRTPSRANLNLNPILPQHSSSMTWGHKNVYFRGLPARLKLMMYTKCLAQNLKRSKRSTKDDYNDSKPHPTNAGDNSELGTYG